MAKAMSVLIGLAIGTAMVVAALWTALDGSSLVAEWSRPGPARWAVFFAAMALLAGAQVVLASLVAQPVYGRDRFGDRISAIGGLVCTLSLASAVTLGIVGH